ncbi:MAG TPA: glycosyltransferase [Gemmataceae bacterium]|jgi:glycosyltransferase involved in cell wall biosynthesis|nr:glycosyltransferase [Gemmataceae bacterium]
MRILVLTNLYPNPFQPNRATFNRQQFRELAASHSVAVISPIAWTDELAARRKGCAALPHDRRVLCDGISVEHPRYLYPPKMLRNWYGHFFQRSVRAAFERACTAFRPDMVLAPWAYPDGWAAVRLGRQAGLPVVIKVHGCDILCGGAGLDRYPGRRRRTADALRQADAVIAVSRHLAGKVVELGVSPGRVDVVYDGIDPTVFHPGPTPDPRPRLGVDPDLPLVLFIGNLVPVKGVEILLDACGRLAQRGLKFTAGLIGEGPLRAALERQVNRLGLEGQVKLLGPLPQRQLGDWYRAASVFVLPSYSEGVPCVLLEAAACGTPFVATQVGGIPEIAHLGPSRLVTPGDAEGLALAIADRITGSVGRKTARPESARSHGEAAAELAGLFEQVIRASQPEPLPC